MRRASPARPPSNSQAGLDSAKAAVWILLQQRLKPAGRTLSSAKSSPGVSHARYENLRTVFIHPFGPADRSCPSGLSLNCDYRRLRSAGRPGRVKASAMPFRRFVGSPLCQSAQADSAGIAQCPVHQFPFSTALGHPRYQPVRPISCPTAPRPSVQVHLIRQDQLPRRPRFVELAIKGLPALRRHPFGPDAGSSRDSPSSGWHG